MGNADLVDTLITAVPDFATLRNPRLHIHPDLASEAAVPASLHWKHSRNDAHLVSSFALNRILAEL
jgi:hypothetical protein